MRFFFFFQAEDGIRDYKVTGVQTCALPICPPATKRSYATAASRARRNYSVSPSLNPSRNRKSFSCLALIAFRRIVRTSTYGGGSDQADQLRHLVQDHRAHGRSRTTRRRHSRVTVQLGSHPERNCDEHRTRLGRQ